jgi:hypothetical protein
LVVIAVIAAADITLAAPAGKSSTVIAIARSGCVSDALVLADAAGLALKHTTQIEQTTSNRDFFTIDAPQN